MKDRSPGIALVQKLTFTLLMGFGLLGTTSDVQAQYDKQDLKDKKAQVHEDKRDLKREKKELKRDEKLLKKVEKAYGSDSPETQAIRKRVEDGRQDVDQAKKDLGQSRAEKKEIQQNLGDRPINHEMGREKSEISHDKKELKKDKRDLKRDAKLLRAVEKSYGADSPEAAQLRKRVEDSQAEVNASQAELERDRTQKANLKKIKKLDRAERKFENKYDRMVQKHGENSKDAIGVQEKLNEHQKNKQQLIEENQELSESESSHHGD